MGTAQNRLGLSALGLLAVISAMLFGTAASARAADTVTITGNAYAFIFAGNLARLEGAVIKVEEFPELEAIAGPNGAYTLEVPDDSDITPYATFPGYYPVHDQTFHTRGKDLNQVNFQMPQQAIAEALAGIVSGETTGEPGSKVLTKCAIVSTFFQKEGRSFLDFDDFHDFRPHGIADATAAAKTQTGEEVVSPIYFNSSVIPTPGQPASSHDGGVLWANVPTGVYTVTGQHETKRFSQFQATCEPGRLVNANPPWGLYELARTEEPNPAVFPYVAPVPEPDQVLDANLASAKVIRKGAKKRALTVKVRSGENVTAAITARQGKRRLRASKKLADGTSTITIPVGATYKPGSLALSVKLTDEAGNSRTDGADLNVPAVKKANKKRK
ncbi:MAG TPA: hypothetical protein VMF31_05130 [Solirubrobacterales bacterium]|nr:hypothetical protein [Solirubrobacterales bacterium]